MHTASGGGEGLLHGVNSMGTIPTPTEVAWVLGSWTGSCPEWWKVPDQKLSTEHHPTSSCPPWMGSHPPPQQTSLEGEDAPLSISTQPPAVMEKSTQPGWAGQVIPCGCRAGELQLELVLRLPAVGLAGPAPPPDWLRRGLNRVPGLCKCRARAQCRASCRSFSPTGPPQAAALRIAFPGRERDEEGGSAWR